jgi:hypothetical protein
VPGEDLVLILRVPARKSCVQSGVMLARVRAPGIFELLTAAAWARALGFLPDELSGKTLRALMPEKTAAAGVIAMLLGEQDGEPLVVTLQCKDERRKSFRFYRRFDAYEKAMFVVADDMVEERREPQARRQKVRSDCTVG